MGIYSCMPKISGSLSANASLTVLGGTAIRVICSDCSHNVNIYSRTREYCAYTYIAKEDVLDQTLSSLVVQLPKETFLSHPPQEASVLESLISSADREQSSFPATMKE
ncbi:leucine-rich repeats and immunoglobulin-like domains protein 2 isoform X4 [Castor canadensis]|uniref:leucine-rich repeats and immunoglobulin-like domains protein 2 isoform X4 n=1 Tax=Castor canadensis TaxID=51338 RepID=UPI003D186CC1